MRRLNVSIKLDQVQTTRLQNLADQCNLTPEQMAAAVAVLALNRQLAEPLAVAGPTGPRLEQTTNSGSGSSPARPTHCRLPETGFLRLAEIVGCREKPGQPPTPRLIPVSRSTWLAGVKSGLYPTPVKLGLGVTAWRVEDIRSLIQSLGTR